MLESVPDIPEFPYQLGKKPPRQYLHEIGAQISTFITDLDLLTQTTPATWAWGSRIKYTMMLNDHEPDCTIATCGHAEQTWSTRTATPDTGDTYAAETPSDAIIEEFFTFTGQQQGLSNDNGRYMAGGGSAAGGAGVLDLWKSRGMLQQVPRDPEHPYEKILG